MTLLMPGDIVRIKPYGTTEGVTTIPRRSWERYAASMQVVGEVVFPGYVTLKSNKYLWPAAALEGVHDRP